MKTNWLLKTAIDTIVFDCDGTLSAIEGIDELANVQHVGPAVKALTQTAMEKTGLNPELYQKRLSLVKPSRDQVQSLGQHYFEHRVADVEEVMQILQHLKKNIYLISAGILDAVVIFGEMLKIPREHIFAVELSFDDEGNFLDFSRSSPLINNSGKRDVIKHIKSIHSEIIYVGDGLNDLAVIDLVTRFIGYGGVFFRENIAKLCEYYLRHRSLAAILPLVLTENETIHLNQKDKLLYQKGLALL